MSKILNQMNNAYSTNRSVPRTKKIREIFNLEGKKEKKDENPRNKYYNKDVFFKDSAIKTRDQISQLIYDVINSSATTLNKDSIQFKVNINNNFYNSKIDVIINDKEKVSIPSTTMSTENNKSIEINTFFSNLYSYKSEFIKKTN